jgi:hypothetical protein
MKKFKDHIEEEVFNHHIVQGSTEKGKVTHSGSLRQMQKAIRDPKMPTDHVLVKTRHDLKTGDDWKKHMHAEASMGGLPRPPLQADDPLKRKKKKEEIMKTVSHPGYDAESKNEELSEAFWQIQIPGIPNPIFIESSSKSSVRKDLRSQLKPDVWKDVSIEKITKPNMVKMYRRLAKEGPPGEEETEEGVIKEIGIIAPLVGMGARYLAKKAVGKAAGTLAPAVAGGVAAGAAHAATKHVLKKKKEKEKINSEYKREPRIRIEGIDVKNADMGDVVKDFQSSDAPQFKGKSKEKKREMAIAAKLNA